MSLHVLFVDDEAPLRSAMSRMFSLLKPDWTVKTACDGAEALALLQDFPADVVVSDMRMPKLTGDKLLEQVRILRPAAARILLTGHSDASSGLASIGVAHRFLAKPCTPETLIAAISISYSLRKLLSKPALMEIVGGASSLPPAPSIYIALVREVDQPDSSLQKIGEIISQDVALTAKVLQLVNSSFFGLGRPVVSPGQAASYLGLSTLKSVVAMANAFGSLVRATHAHAVEQLQVHSLSVGTLCQRIARSSQIAECGGEDALLAGMLHDVGKLLLITTKTAEYELMLEECELTKRPQYEVEREVFGSCHGEIGAALLGLWGLPDQIVEAVAYHHHPRESPSPMLNLASCVHVANALVHLPLGSGFPLETSQILAEWGLVDEQGRVLREYEQVAA